MGQAQVIIFMNNFFASLNSIPIFEGMEFQLKLLPTLMLLGAFQGILLSVILFFYKKNGNILSNKLLSFAVFLMASNLIYAVFFSSGLIINTPYLIRSLDTVQY